MKNFNLHPLGAGVGLRHEHLDDVLTGGARVGWFEIITENFMGFGGAAREALQEIARTTPVIGHGVCLSIGSTDPLDRTYLRDLRRFYDQFGCAWCSDHLSFTMVDHANLNDLIPLPFTEESVKNCVERISIVQDEVGRPFLLENITRYITVSDREMSEAEFITRILEESGCGLLLDITNVHLNALFHGGNPFEFLRQLPLHRVGQVHLAGWEAKSDDEIIDSHDAPVPPEVWALFQDFLRIAGPTSALVEWDASLPSYERLIAEAHLAERYMAIENRVEA
jgi:uncharacterized protein (UPF0276 family)